MTLWCPRGKWSLRLFAALLIVSPWLAGCGQKQTASPEVSKVEPTATASADANPGTAAASPAGSVPGAPATTAVPADALHLPFEQAIRSGENPPADSNPPPERTVTGKSVYKVYKAVLDSWSSIRFTAPDGKKIDYVADIETDAGTIQIALFPELAPNHVRNFIALANAGYYDGLCFERIRDEKGEGTVLRSLEAGCPLGTGEPGYGSIGYWLKEEFQPGSKISHDEGIVGACRSPEPDSAACRFYITLTKSPFLDGKYTAFGKVLHGLDVARTIYAKPVIVDDQDSFVRRPEKPVVIRKVTVHQTSR